MKYVQIKCPECGAALEIEDDLEVCYCKYCGTQLHVSGQSDTAIVEKYKLKTLQEKNAHKRYTMEQQKKERDKDTKIALCIFAALVLFVVAISVGSSIDIHQSEKRAEQEKAQVYALYAEIQVDMAEGNYTEALEKAAQLRGAYGMSSKEKKQWDKTREQLIKDIQKELKKQG